MRYSEFVGAGHIDMVCDNIAESILDYCVRHNKNSRVSIEVTAGQKYIYITGQISCGYVIPYDIIVEQSLLGAGYEKEYYNPQIIVSVEEQSNNISHRVDNVGYKRFGDTNIAYGYATNETIEKLPVEYLVAKRINDALRDCYYDGSAMISQDTKVMVSYDEDEGIITNVFIACQTLRNLNADEEVSIYELVYDALDNITFYNCMMYDKSNVYIDFYTREDKLSDSGTTGRKTAVNCYGLRGAMDGGALVGKDLTKGDRLGKFIARYVAVNLVEAKLCEEVEVFVECYMSAPSPIITVKSNKSKFNDYLLGIITNKVFANTLEYYVDKFQRVNINDLHLEGYFGNEMYPWEKCDRIEELKKII